MWRILFGIVAIVLIAGCSSNPVESPAPERFVGEIYWHWCELESTGLATISVRVWGDEDLHPTCTSLQERQLRVSPYGYNCYPTDDGNWAYQWEYIECQAGDQFVVDTGYDSATYTLQ